MVPFVVSLCQGECRPHLAALSGHSVGMKIVSQIFLFMLEDYRNSQVLCHCAKVLTPGYGMP